MEPLENECLSRLEICGLCNERVDLNAMKVRFSLLLVAGMCLLVLVKQKTLKQHLTKAINYI